MSKKDKDKNGNNGTPPSSGAPTPPASRLPESSAGSLTVKTLEANERLVLEQLMADKRVLTARTETVKAERTSLEHQRTILAQQGIILDQQGQLLDTKIANIDRVTKANTDARLKFLADLGVDAAKYSTNLVDGQLVLTEK